MRFRDKLASIRDNVINFDDKAVTHTIQMLFQSDKTMKFLVEAFVDFYWKFQVSSNLTIKDFFFI